MRIFYFTLLIILSFTNLIKANEKDQTINILQNGGKLIFIRHAYAPGGGDPENFNINDCSTQRNLNSEGRNQALKIGKILEKLKIENKNIYSSEWCRCKETAKIAFGNYKTVNFLNSFFDEKFLKYKDKQVSELKKFIKGWKENEDLILVTHYVVINEILNITTNSGDIVFFDKDYNVLKVINSMN